MSKNKNQTITDSKKEDSKISKSIEDPKQNNSQFLITFLVFLIAILLGILIQQNFLADQTSQQKTTEPIAHQNIPDINSLLLELKETFKQELHQELQKQSFIQTQTQKSAEIQQKTLKHEIINEVNSFLVELKETLKQELHQEVQKQTLAQTQTQKSAEIEQKIAQDDIINEAKEEERVETKITKEESRVLIDDKKVQDKVPEIKFENGQPIIIDTQNLKFKTETKQEVKKDTEKEKTKKQEIKKEKSQTNEEIPEEVKNFKSKTISHIKPKKMWIPIPNSNGGHRRVPPIEIKMGKEHGSSVKVWLFEEFLSKEECEHLIQAHESHLKEMLAQKPIICFDSISTLKRNLIDLNREKIAEKVTPNDFTKGTYCLNQTFSRQLEKWGLKWSYSTAFYPGESKFSRVFGKRIEEATMLNETHGGKFQITSYPHDVGYKDHTDCLVDSNDKRDRYATFLVYLNDLGADGGGETIFPELGIDVKPRQGRALTWNNMDYETGKCEPKSIHKAAKVKHEVKKKYIIQRWYYYKNFYALGKRMSEAILPERPPNTPKVSCDNYDYGSCRMYDEWNPDHMIDYQKDKKLY